MIVQLRGCLWETEKMKRSGIKNRIIAGAAIGLMCLLTLSMLAPTVSASTASWEFAFPMGAARTQALVAQDTNGVVYVAGGTGLTGFVTDGVMRAYNPGTGTWATLSGMGYFVRGSSGGIGEDGRVYLISGWRSSITAPTPRVQIYNITTDSWSLGTDIPNPVWEAKSFNTGDHFYVVGGEPLAGGVSGMVQIYNVTTNSWWTGTDMPDNRTSGATVVYNGYGYYFGGVNESDDPMSTVFRYNIAADSWTQMAPIPAPMCAQTAIIGQDGLAYVFGGANEAFNLPTTTNGFGYAYNFASDSWTAISDLNVPRAWLGAALYDNKVLAIGGNDNANVYASVESLDTLQNQINNLQNQVTLLQNQLTQANDDIAGLTGNVSDLTAKNVLLKQQLVNLSAQLNQTTDDLNAALNTANGKANDAKSAADSANMVGMIGIIVGIVAIIIAVIALVMKRKAPIQQMQPQPPMPPQ